jgi:hypothetical protein
MRIATPYAPAGGRVVRVLSGRPLKVQKWSPQQGGAVASQQPVRALSDAVAVLLLLPRGLSEELQCRVRVRGRRSRRGGRCAIEAYVGDGSALGVLGGKAPIRAGACFWSDRKRRAAGAGPPRAGEQLAVVDTYAPETEANALFEGPVLVVPAQAAAGGGASAGGGGGGGGACGGGGGGGGSGGDAGLPPWPLVCCVVLSQAGRHSDAESYDLHLSEVSIEFEPRSSAEGRAALGAACTEAQAALDALVAADCAAGVLLPPGPAHTKHGGRRRKIKGR